MGRKGRTVEGEINNVGWKKTNILKSERLKHKNEFMQGWRGGGMDVERWPEAKLNCRVAVSGKKGIRERHEPRRRGEVMRQVERRMKRWQGGRDILYLIISIKDSERNSKSRAVNGSYVY